MRSVPCVRSWHSLDHLPFDDGICLPFGIPSQKKGSTYEFLALVLVFVFRRRVYFLLVEACGAV